MRPKTEPKKSSSWLLIFLGVLLIVVLVLLLWFALKGSEVPLNAVNTPVILPMLRGTSQFVIPASL